MMSKLKLLASPTLIALIGALSLSACGTLGAIAGGDEERANNARAEREANPGPCPRAFTLYETSRMVQLNGAERYANVGFTGEINKVRSLCRYYGTAPIDANVEIDMSFGRGPAAGSATHTYYYFVAVTRKNIDVIEKQYFPVEITFPPGVNVMTKTEVIDSVTIPRAKETTSGANFEIIVGFDLTPEQYEFNAAGKRFRVSSDE